MGIDGGPEEMHNKPHPKMLIEQCHFTYSTNKSDETEVGPETMLTSNVPLLNKRLKQHSLSHSSPPHCLSVANLMCMHVILLARLSFIHFEAIWSAVSDYWLFIWYLHYQ